MILPVSAVSLNNRNSFTAKKFRLPVEEFMYTIDGITLWSKKAYAVKEFSNPNAEQLYKQAKQAKDIREKARLYAEMGHYELVDMNIKEKIKTFLHLPLP